MPLPVDRNADGVGPLDVPHARIGNPIVRAVLRYAQDLGAPASVIEHPRETVTCAEKRDVFQEYRHLYESYGDIRISRGALLSVEASAGPSLVLHVADSEEPIDFKGLKQLLGLSKKRDIRFFQGDVEASIGLPQGGVSPFVASHARLDSVVFAKSLSAADHSHRRARWDFAFNTRQSMVIDPRALMAYMRERSGFRMHLLTA
jgi:hypothetical protein